MVELDIGNKAKENGQVSGLASVYLRSFITGITSYLGQSTSAKIELVVSSKNREILSCCLKFEQFDDLTARS